MSAARWIIGLVILLATGQGSDCRAQSEVVADDKLQITAPPAELKIPAFYKKFISADGYPIVASEQVNDYAVREAAFLVNQMLAHRSDVRKAMIASGSRMCILAHNEFTTDLPEFAKLKTPSAYAPLSDKDYWDARARGTGGSETDPYCSCGEENLLGYPGDPYASECILIHEFAHNIHLRGLVRVDPTFDRRLQETYEKAMSQGLWKGKYASVNSREYFAEGVQSWFDNNRENDHDHNHVNTRAELLDYDPGLAALCREVFGETKLTYTKPATRLSGHLTGYDPKKAPTFTWPERLTQAKAEIKRRAEERSQTASGNTHDVRTIAGWTVRIHKQLFTQDEKATNTALELLTAQLQRIVLTVPQAAVAELRKVPLWISLEYPGVRPRAEYHPAAGWLREHSRDPAMAKAIEFTNVRIFPQECRRMPVFVLHELAHAYHDRVLEYTHTGIKAAFEKAKAGGKYDRVQRRDAEGNVRLDRAYALSNEKEYFAECSEAFFGTNDFFPFTVDELKAHDPEMFALLKQVWGVRGAEP